MKLQRGLQTGLVVKTRSGLVHVCFSLQLKVNSLELDSQVGVLVYYVDNINELTQIDLVEYEHILCDAPSGFPPSRVQHRCSRGRDWTHELLSYVSEGSQTF